jgi:hypothetical protein
MRDIVKTPQGRIPEAKAGRTEAFATSQGDVVELSGAKREITRRIKKEVQPFVYVAQPTEHITMSQVNRGLVEPKRESAQPIRTQKAPAKAAKAPGQKKGDGGKRAGSGRPKAKR